jgi:uncharacterized membrane protein YhaH (DUF805 family)
VSNDHPQYPQDGQPQYGQPQYGQPQYGQPQYGQPQYGGGPGPVGQAGEPPLWAPWYGISFPKAFVRFWKKYVRFDGRASRSEYWWWILWSVIASVVFNIIDAVLTGATGTTTTTTTSGYAGFSTMSSNPVSMLPSGLWGIATLLPGIALLMRRLHDADFSGWWWLLAFIPFFGWIALLVMVLQSSKPRGQRFDRPDKG